MNIEDFKKSHPVEFQQIFAMGFNTGLACRDNSARNRVFGDPRVEAAELIANADARRRDPQFTVFPGV